MSASPPFRQERLRPIHASQACVASDSPASDPAPAYTLGGKDQSPGGWRLEVGGSYFPHTDCVGTVASRWLKQSAQAEMLAGEGQEDEQPTAGPGPGWWSPCPTRHGMPPLAAQLPSRRRAPDLAVPWQAPCEDAWCHPEVDKGRQKKREMPRRATEITIIIINFFPSCSTTENSGVSKSLSHVVLIIYLGRTDRRYFTFLLPECVIIFLLYYVCETRVWGRWYFTASTGMLRDTADST